jgi:hypothetical protein
MSGLTAYRPNIYLETSITLIWSSSLDLLGREVLKIIQYHQLIHFQADGNVGWHHDGWGEGVDADRIIRLHNALAWDIMLLLLMF